MSLTDLAILILCVFVVPLATVLTVVVLADRYSERVSVRNNDKGSSQ